MKIKKESSTTKKMTEISTCLSITLNAKGLNSPIKRQIGGLDWKNKTQPFVANKKYNSLVKNIGLKWNDGKWYSKQMEPELK
jgi:hypothetical protein